MQNDFMKKTISIFSKGKSLWCGLLLTGGLLLFGTSTTIAQVAAAGSVNPYTHVAEKLSVPAYALGTFDRAHTMDVLESILSGLRQSLSNGGGTSYQKLKYAYCSAVMSDVSTRYVASEISLLTSLSGLDAVKNTTGTQQTVLVTLYNEVVSQLQ
jgi:hypothetical protein